MHKKPAPLLVVCLILLAGCGVFRPGFETPTVSVSSFRALPSDGMVPTFEIGLRIVNPNPIALSLSGLSYTINLAGNELIKGVASDLPRVGAYDEGEVKLTATPNLLAGAKLVADLMRANTNSVDYAFEAKLDLVGIGPPLRVRDAGTVSLGASR